MLNYSSGPAKHIRETNSSSDEVYLIKVNKLTKALSLEKAGHRLSQAELCLHLSNLVQRTSHNMGKCKDLVKIHQRSKPSLGFECHFKDRSVTGRF